MSAAPRSPWEACVNNAGSPDSTDITRWNYDASCNTLQVGNELVSDMVADCSNYSNEKSSCIFQTGLNLQGQGTAPVTNIQWNQERRDNLTSSGTSSIQQAPNFLPNGSQCYLYHNHAVGGRKSHAVKAALLLTKKDGTIACRIPQQTTAVH